MKKRIRRARKRLAEATRRLKQARKGRKRVNRLLGNKTEKRDKARQRRKNIAQRLEKLYRRQAAAIEKGEEEREEKLDKEIAELLDEDEQLMLALRTVLNRIHVLKRARKKAYKRVRWAAVSRTKRRKDLKRLRRKAQQDVGPGDFEPWMANGDPWQKLGSAERACIARGVHVGAVVTSTYEGYPGDGVHSSTSLHYKAEAVDFGGPYSGYKTHYENERKRGADRYDELFGPGGWYIKYGVVYGGQFPHHETHTHDAPRS